MSLSQSQLQDERFGAQRRRHARSSVKITAALVTNGRFKFEVVVTDLSLSGFQVETHAELNVGERVLINFPGLKALVAHVMHKEGFQYGLGFESPLYIAVFENIVAHFTPPSR
jgi:hypothetical protein